MATNAHTTNALSRPDALSLARLQDRYLIHADAHTSAPHRHYPRIRACRSSVPLSLARVYDIPCHPLRTITGSIFLNLLFLPPMASLDLTEMLSSRKYAAYYEYKARVSRFIPWCPSASQTSAPTPVQL